MDFLVVSLSAHKPLTNFSFHVFLLFDQDFVRGFCKSITLRVIGSGVAKGDVVFVTEIYHFLGFKGSCIISNELSGASKS